MWGKFDLIKQSIRCGSFAMSYFGVDGGFALALWLLVILRDEDQDLAEAAANC